jgi:exonuclease III
MSTKTTDRMTVNGTTYYILDKTARDAVAAEKTLREQADSAEVQNRNSAISEAIATEVTNRNSAISEAIATEVTNRTIAINTLKDAISNTTENLIVFNTDEFTMANVHGVSSGHGTFVLNGTASSEAIKAIADDFTIPAGTYYFGCVPDVTDEHIVLQLRKIVGDTDMGNIVATGNYSKFTLTESTVVRVRIHFDNGANYNGVEVCPILAKTSDWFSVHVPNQSAADYEARNKIERYAEQFRPNPSTDFDDFTEPGYYLLSSSQVYDHSPDGVARVSMLLGYKEKNTGAYFVQIYIGLAAKKMYTRRRSGSSLPGAWTAWDDFKLYDYQAQASPSSTDLDDFVDLGSYQLSSSTTYTNSPTGRSGASMLQVFTERSSSNYRVQVFFDFVNGIAYYRRRAGSPMAWGGWAMFTTAYDATERTISESYTSAAQDSQGTNTGSKLRVMSYNICRFNNDTATYISDSMLLNLKKMFYQANADILLLQEDREHIDSDSTRTSAAFVYNPVYPTGVGTGGPTIRAKEALSNTGLVYYTNGRELRYAVLTVGTDKVLLLSTHPVWNYDSTGGESAESIAARKQQYEEMFAWANGDMTLEDGGGNAVTVPTHTHCIIGMDGNCSTAQDKNNLKNAATEAGFILGNGGNIGWFVTEMRDGNSAVDNVIVSDNVIINNVESYCDWYSKLYSDHVPVVADLTLL